MKTIHYFILLLTLSSFAGNAQRKPNITFLDDDPTPIYYKWLGTESKILTKIKLKYKKPVDFKEISKTECFKEYPKLEEAFSCLSNQLHSNDGQFIAFMQLYGLSTNEKGKNRRFSIDHVNFSHIWQLRYPIKILIGKETESNWKDFVSYYPEDITKNTFNADTALRFSITLKPENYYKNKFKYVKALYIQKNGNGFVNFYCFYSDKAKKNLDYYWKKIEEVLRYED